LSVSFVGNVLAVQHVTRPLASYEIAECSRVPSRGILRLGAPEIIKPLPLYRGHIWGLFPQLSETFDTFSCAMQDIKPAEPMRVLLPANGLPQLTLRIKSPTFTSLCHPGVDPECRSSSMHPSPP
jgi:hypothetical protein